MEVEYREFLGSNPLAKLGLFIGVLIIVGTVVKALAAALGIPIIQ
jgi:hypothetical protein